MTARDTVQVLASTLAQLVADYDHGNRLDQSPGARMTNARHTALHGLAAPDVPKTPQRGTHDHSGPNGGNTT